MCRKQPSWTQCPLFPIKVQLPKPDVADLEREVAEAAILCPSFYRADVLRNASGWERFKARLRANVISFLQRRRERGRHLFARGAA